MVHPSLVFLVQTVGATTRIGLSEPGKRNEGSFAKFCETALDIAVPSAPIVGMIKLSTLVKSRETAVDLDRSMFIDFTGIKMVASPRQKWDGQRDLIPGFKSQKYTYGDTYMAALLDSLD